MKLAVVGATGLVGRMMLEVLAERRIPVAELIPLASPRSRGLTVRFAGRAWPVSALEDERWRGADAALLSPGAKVSRAWIPRLAEAGVTCIDNSSAFRRDPDVPLVVPEVNPQTLRGGGRIVANPNCSTIQLVAALWPLHQAFGLEEVVVATYQSASGAGQTGISQLMGEMEGEITETSPFPHPLYQNLIPAIGPVEEGFYLEEWKLVWETRKILGLPDLRVFPTAVRVPVTHCHSEAAHLRFREEIDHARARELLQAAPGVVLQDQPEEGIYPQPLSAAGRDEVFVGRIRQVPGQTRTLDMWIVADNLRKGAATNAVQILEYLLVNDLL
ncbi:MAG: aspartate-semialdehyde dehydrogenase [Candidatus Zixiibacteriota bacterium]|nr:MAG: aspartate-semialdehyde dehydrogenase [candidate division Zixibacteria bacterium]